MPEPGAGITVTMPAALRISVRHLHLPFDRTGTSLAPIRSSPSCAAVPRHPYKPNRHRPIGGRHRLRLGFNRLATFYRSFHHEFGRAADSAAPNGGSGPQLLIREPSPFAALHAMRHRIADASLPHGTTSGNGDGPHRQGLLLTSQGPALAKSPTVIDGICPRKPGSHPTPRWRRQSRANRSLNPNSLLAGKMQGISSIVGSTTRQRARKRVPSQWLTGQFPTRPSREFFAPLQGIKIGRSGKFPG